MKKRCCIPATLLTIVCLTGLMWTVVPHRARAQNQFGQITGLVMDSSRSSIPGANVVVTNEETRVSRQAVTTGDGNYNVPSLVPGRYRVAATKTGFETVTQTDVVLQVGQTARVDFALPVGTVSQQVEVQASAATALQTESAEIGNVVPEAGVVNLPLNGRDYLQLATLVPGTNSAGLGKSDEGMPWNNLNINGMRQSATAYVIDGADVMEQFDSGTAYAPAPDAIQEFKVETNNMTAQYGGGGGIVNVVLRSGTNDFHGNLYEFWRNDILDARNYFAQTNPELRYNQFGTTIGGPVKHDKLFFFGDYEGSRFVNGVTYNTFVPTGAERQGNFTGVNQIRDPYTGQPLASDTVTQIAPQAARTLLGRMRIGGDAADKLVRDFSGGERRRIMLARLMARKADVLLLDEPTNDLDIDSREALESVLCEYEGAIVVVSHDRFLLARLADRVLWIDDGRWGIVDGGYDAYEASAREREAAAFDAAARAAPARPKATRQTPLRVRSQLQARIARIERDIEAGDTRIAAIEELFTQPELYADRERVKAMEAEIAQLRALSRERVTQWERLLHDLDSLPADGA